MRPLRPLLHLLALLFALGHGFVPAAAAIADGALVGARGGDRAAVHVEQLGGSGCRVVHTDACELCRLLSLHGTPGHAAGAPPTPLERAASLPSDAAVHRGRAAAPAPLPRGPPAA
jgi:hypothetical protein